MNERIKQLYEQAHVRKPTMVVDHETGRAVQATFRGEPMYTKDFDPEKFAELLVRECTNLLPNDSIRNEDGVHMFYVIRDHFGVSGIEGVR